MVLYNKLFSVVVVSSGSFIHEISMKRMVILFFTYILSGPDRPNGVPSYPSSAPPRRPAVRRPEPTGPWCVRVLDSTG